MSFSKYFQSSMLLMAAFSIVALAARVATEPIPAPNISWNTPARLRHRIGSTPGTLTFDQRGIHFRPLKGAPLNWSFIEVQSFDLTQHEFTVKSYENRNWRLPGEKAFRFTLTQAIPPSAASFLAEEVGKPSRNEVPDPHLPSFAVIPARHATLSGGSNGLLRFRNEGIDYVTLTGKDSRSWRWADIQTLARPDAYHLTVGGYLETFDFDLKQPISQTLFDRLWDCVYGRGLQISTKSEKASCGVSAQAPNASTMGNR
jgi:hypothetical protein